MGRLIVSRLVRRLRARVVHRDTKPSDQPTPPKQLRGWDEIASALEVSDSTAMGYAARDVDPLPVWYDHAHRPCVYHAALLSWIERQALWHRTYHVLRRAGQLPGQVRKEGRSPKRSTRAAMRAKGDR